MDFKKSLLSELDSKYVLMLKGETDDPFPNESISDYQTFVKKNNSYHSRIDSEFREFNKAVSEIKDRRDKRIRAENQAKADHDEAVAHTRYVIAKFFKTLAFLLPIVLSCFVAVDIFSNKEQYSLSASFGWIVTGWVVFSLISVIVSITLLIKLYNNEKFYTNKKSAIYGGYYKDFDADTKKKFKRLAITVTAFALIICCFNFGTYIKWGLESVEELTIKANKIPSVEEINYSEYEQEIEDAYAIYSTFDFWQKPLLKNESEFLKVIAGFNQYRVDNVKKAMDLISLDNVSEGDILRNAVALYSALNDEQRALLTQEDIKRFDTFTTVSDVVDKLYEINDNIVDRYGNVDEVIEIYQTIDDNYKEYVYNYNLVAAFREQYEYINQFIFENVDGGYSIRAKDGVSVSGSLIIPEKYKNENVVLVAEGAFKDNESITSVLVPNTVTQIGFGAFSGCNNISQITIPFVGKTSSTDTPRWAVFGYIFGDDNISDDNMESSSTIHKTSEGSYTSQLVNSGSSYFYYNIPRSLRTVIVTNQENVPDYAFNNCDLLETITFEKSLQSVGTSSFRNCSALKSVDISNGVTEIKEYSYMNCSSLTSINIPNSVTSIQRGAFYGCNNIKTLVVPDSVTNIVKDAFGGWSSLESITIPFVGRQMSTDTARWAVFGYIFGDGDLSDDSMNSSSTIHKTSSGVYTSQLVYSGSSWFHYDIPSTLKTVVITQQQDIPNYAFNNCDLLETITFVKPLKSIGTSAFRNCSDLNKVDISEGVTEIKDFAYMNCSSLTDITIPNSVTSIRTGAFYGCSGITSIVVPDSVKIIYSGAFGGCSSLESITLPFIGKEASTDTPRWAVFGYIFGDGDVVNDTMESSSTIRKTSSGVYTSQLVYSGSSWFYYDIPTSLKTVVITQQTKIPNYAFNNCDLLETITFLRATTSVGTDAFRNCNAEVN